MTEVGKEIIAYCTSCRLDLAHVVVAKNEGKIVQVLCNTCKKHHAYHSPKGNADKAKAPRSGRKTSKKVLKSVAQEWAEQMSLRSDLEAKPYSINGLFQVGDLISHFKFGNGIVLKSLGTQTFEAIFENGIKLMAQGRT